MGITLVTPNYGDCTASHEGSIEASMLTTTAKGGKFWYNSSKLSTSLEMSLDQGIDDDNKNLQACQCAGGGGGGAPEEEDVISETYEQPWVVAEATGHAGYLFETPNAYQHMLFTDNLLDGGGCGCTSNNLSIPDNAMLATQSSPDMTLLDKHLFQLTRAKEVSFHRHLQLLEQFPSLANMADMLGKNAQMLLCQLEIREPPGMLIVPREIPPSTAPSSPPVITTHSFCSKTPANPPGHTATPTLEKDMSKIVSFATWLPQPHPNDDDGDHKDSVNDDDVNNKKNTDADAVIVDVGDNGEEPLLCGKWIPLCHSCCLQPQTLPCMASDYDDSIHASKLFQMLNEPLSSGNDDVA